jgi:hypothetical protein
VSADGGGQVPAHLRVVGRDGPQVLRPLALDGRRRHECRAEAGPHKPEHQRVVDDLERRLRGAERVVDDGPHTPARRKPQDHLVPEIRGVDPVALGERVVRAADEDHRLAPEVVQDDSAREVTGDAVASAGAQRDVRRAVADRLQVPRGTCRGLPQLDDDTRVAVPDACEDLGEVKRPGVERARQRDRTAYLPGYRGHVVPGRLHRLEDPEGAGLQRRAVFGQGDRGDVTVEQRDPEFPLQPGDGAGHGRLDDVGLAGGRRKAARLATRQEVFQVTDVHGAMLGPINAIDCVLRKQPLDKFR